MVRLLYYTDFITMMHELCRMCSSQFQLSFKANGYTQIQSVKLCCFIGIYIMSRCLYFIHLILIMSMKYTICSMHISIYNLHHCYSTVLTLC